jgi:hypothetical protein
MVKAVVREQSLGIIKHPPKRGFIQALERAYMPPLLK